MYYAALAIIILIFIWRIVAGFKKGMVQELISLVSMIVAGFCLILIMSGIGSYMEAQMGETLQMIMALLIVCIIYKVANVLFTSLKLISNLPVIKGINALMGAVVGAVEAIVIICFLVQFLKFFSLSLIS